ncbi:MAG: hypothetical protein ABSH28_04820 [Acidobacteriota bacterium]
MATSRKRKERRAAAASHGTQIDLPNVANGRAQQANEASETRSLEQAGLDKLRVLYPNGHPRFLQLLIEEARLHHNKNHDYAKGGPVFGNFERVAAILRLYPGFPYDTREGVNVTYLLKQLDCILWGMCQRIEYKVEGAGPRAGDISVYVKLLRLMFEELEAAV